MYDLPCNVPYFSVLFADDISATALGDDLIWRLHNLYALTSHWFEVNGLFVNDTETQVLVFTSSPSWILVAKFVHLNGTAYVSSIDNVKFLGLHLDKH